MAGPSWAKGCPWGTVQPSTAACCLPAGYRCQAYGCEALLALPGPRAQRCPRGLCLHAKERWAMALPQKPCLCVSHGWEITAETRCVPHLPPSSISEATLGTRVLLPGSLDAQGRNGLFSHGTGHRNASASPSACTDGLKVGGRPRRIAPQPLASSQPDSTGTSW